MKQIDGIPAETVSQVIQELANKIGPRYKFGYHSAEDMAGQAVLEAVRVINQGKFTAGPAQTPEELVQRLKAFLATHMRNRLNNFVRDFSCRYSSENNKYNSRKYNIMHPVKVDFMDEVFTGPNFDHDIELNELIRCIRSKLTIEELKLFLKLQNRVRVDNKKKEKLLQKVKDILNETQSEA